MQSVVYTNGHGGDWAEWRDIINGVIGAVLPGVREGGGRSPVRQEGPIQPGRAAIWYRDGALTYGRGTGEGGDLDAMLTPPASGSMTGIAMREANGTWVLREASIVPPGDGWMPGPAGDPVYLTDDQGNILTDDNGVPLTTGDVTGGSPGLLSLPILGQPQNGWVLKFTSSGGPNGALLWSAP